MGKICQITTELLPLIHLKNGLCALSWAFFGQLSSKLFIRVDIWTEWFGIVQPKRVKFMAIFCP